MNDVITLISYTEEVDSCGDMVRTASERNVFADVASIGTKEFYQAAAVGMQPEIKFIIADYLDYRCEKDLAWNGEQYRVLRTYRKDNRLEIIAYKEAHR